MAAGKRLDMPDGSGKPPLHHACERVEQAAYSRLRRMKQYEGRLVELPRNEMEEHIRGTRLASEKQSLKQADAETKRYFAVVRLLVAAGLDPEAKSDSGPPVMLRPNVITCTWPLC